MNDTLDEFRRLLAAAYDPLCGMSDAAAGRPVAPGKWSRKQILGHLIDSAANNHQRFVRGQLAAEFSFPGYEQDRWVEVQRYAEASWGELLALWHSYNVRLLHTAAAIPPEKLANRCRTGEEEAVTLAFLVEDYVRHLRHHLAQIVGEENLP